MNKLLSEIRSLHTKEDGEKSHQQCNETMPEFGMLMDSESCQQEPQRSIRIMSLNQVFQWNLEKSNRLMTVGTPQWFCLMKNPMNTAKKYGGLSDDILLMGGELEEKIDQPSIFGGWYFFYAFLRRKERIMRKYVVKLPRGIEVDIFNLPEDFEEQIKESFEGYTEETAKEYRYCDKLGYIDRCVWYLNNGKDSEDAVNEIVERRILYEWRENGEIIQEDDVYCFEFMNECYDRGNKDASLYSHFGNDDHHIFDQIQKVLVKVITIVMNYED